MSLEFRHIAHAYGENPALHDVSFVAPTGEITCLLGSSGCGKSTLLNLAAGLLPVQAGAILIDGSEIASQGSNPPPEHRPVGMMFQDGALFPHMSVAQNVAFGLAPSGSTGVDEWLGQVGLADLGERYPHELSGGQQQRVALARAMAAEPQVLLMDEPFASVDIVLRRVLRRECRRLLRARHATVVMVTHDPEEALDIGDRIAVMEAGRIVQFGTPQELYTNPKSARVGSIFHGAQIVAAKREGDWLITPFGDWPLASVAGTAPDEGACELLVREGQFAFAEPTPGADGLVLIDIREQGAAQQLVFANHANVEFTVHTDTRAALETGARYALVPAKGSVLAFQ